MSNYKAMNNLPTLNPLLKFIRAESFSGFVLFFATLLALVLANSPLNEFYQSIWQFEIGIKSSNFELSKPLILWVNDGFMAVFFFLIGLEIKREILIEELNTLKKASLPIFAALGGMLFPLFMYLIFNDNPITNKGWGISMATDIAFSLGILKILGQKVPLGLKIFLTAFAIIDDLGAVLVIALFYTTDIQWILLIYAGIILLVLYFLSYKQIHKKILFFSMGLLVWLLFLKSGVHPTIAGILLAIAVPMHRKIDEFTFAEKLKKIVHEITANWNTNELPILTKKQIEEIDNLEEWTNKVQSPLQLLEHRLHNWVAFMIMPIFAFANSGVNIIDLKAIDFNLSSNIALSLFAGKFIGISLITYLVVKLKIAFLPEGVNFQQIIGVAFLAGIGFTMSLFIGNLAFIDDLKLLNSAKIGIIIGSIFSGILGYVIFKFSLNKKEK